MLPTDVIIKMLTITKICQVTKSHNKSNNNSCTNIYDVLGKPGNLPIHHIFARRKLRKQKKNNLFHTASMSNQLLLLPIRQMTGKSKEEAQFSVWLLPAAIILPRPDFTLIFNSSSRSFPPAVQHRLLCGLL